MKPRLVYWKTFDTNKIVYNIQISLDCREKNPIFLGWDPVGLGVDSKNEQNIFLFRRFFEDEHSWECYLRESSINDNYEVKEV